MSDTKRGRIHKLKKNKDGGRYEVHWVLCVNADRWNKPFNSFLNYRTSKRWINVTCKHCLKTRK